MRCLASLAEWEQLSRLCRVEWRKSEPHIRKEMALIAAHAAWHMGNWEEMEVYVDTVDTGHLMGNVHAGSNGVVGVVGGIAGSRGGLVGVRKGVGESMSSQTSTGAFLRSVLLIRREQYDDAQKNIERARGKRGRSPVVLGVGAVHASEI